MVWNSRYRIEWSQLKRALQREVPLARGAKAVEHTLAPDLTRHNGEVDVPLPFRSRKLQHSDTVVARRDRLASGASCAAHAGFAWKHG